MKLGKVVTAIALSATAAMFALPASAVVIPTSTWTIPTFSAPTNGTSLGTSGNGNASAGITGTNSGGTLTGRAFSTPVGSSTLQQSCLNGYSGGMGVVSNADDAQNASGAGRFNCASDSPDHAIDNKNGIDGVLLQFSSLVMLTNVTIGWVDTDSDFSVFYYNPTAGLPATPDLLTKSLANTTLPALGANGPGSGWTLLTTKDGGAGAASYDLGNSTISAAYWYISAYNGSLAGALEPGCVVTKTQKSCAAYRNDYFKISSISAKKTPEPASLALFGLGLAGVAFARRRRQA